ncbi:MAG: hypothetical protein V4683_10055 [Bacteroidota bacterium]
MPDLREFETALMKRLSVGEVDKAFLKTASSTIMNLRKNGLIIDRIYVKGRPRPDRYIINGIVDPEFWNKFKDLGGAFNRFEVFPYGIVNPEGFKFEANVRM